MMNTALEPFRKSSNQTKFFFWFNILISPRLLVGVCKPVVITPTRIKPINVRANFIELHVDAPINKKSTPQFQFTFDPPLQQGQHFITHYLIAENSLPYYHNPRRNSNTSVVGLKLLSGKTWIANPSLTPALYITSAFYCQHPNEVRSYNATISRVRIATFQPQKPICPSIPKLRDASPALTKYLSQILQSCSNLRVLKSKKLHQNKILSMNFLLPNVELLLVDGSDQDNFTAATHSVDKFLGPHSVLDIVWEPYSDDEPKWFILMPHPRGMPGHLFAMIDNVQWHHPSVQVSKNKTLLQPQCNQSYMKPGCVMGCPGTFLSRMTASGFGADSWHLVIDARRALLWHWPVQTAPLRLGQPKFGGPDWQGQIGWTYTYGTCPSNFMDCYFIEHSPCPVVTVDPYDVLVFNRSRVRAWNIPGTRKLDFDVFSRANKWWYDVMQTEPLSGGGAYIPNQSVGSYDNIAAEHTFYTYMWRPKYEVRKEIHRRVNDFNLTENCAAMHVRRGDVVTHGGGQARPYVRVESYVRAARPLMDAMYIKTVLLFTDSQSAIDEANNCTRDYPDVCEGIKFRFVEKKRWYGAEGGWENPFPSGSPQQEIYIIQEEFALVQKCQMMIMGNSNYGDKLYMHMCCGFPLHQRGRLPQRCICPPKIKVGQSGFGTCEEGNLLFCKNITVDESTFTKTNIARAPSDVSLQNYENGFVYQVQDNSTELQRKIGRWVKTSLKLACTNYDHGPLKPTVCGS